ncbi:hypothetical protein MESS4_590018 [Mesorhizobium sp. STM 4661]|nr:hypothetical protein MESS4_590018 [Mesorhizobium sp. STM 4661]
MPLRLASTLPCAGSAICRRFPAIPRHSGRLLHGAAVKIRQAPPRSRHLHRSRVRLRDGMRLIFPLEYGASPGHEEAVSNRPGISNAGFASQCHGQRVARRPVET